MSDAEVDRLLREARAALEGGDPAPAAFVIPVGARRWRVVCHDLVVAGENDFGIPPKAFAHGAVGMLAAALGASECYAAEAASAGPAMALPAVDPVPGEGVLRQALVVTLFRKNHLEVHIQPYERVARGGWRWGEVTVRTRTEPGPLGAALPLWRAVSREPAPLPPPDDLIEEMRDGGFIITEEGPGVDTGHPSA